MSMNKGLTSARWLPILMGLVVAILTAFIWKALDRQESAQIVQMGQLAAASVKSEILAQMESQTLALVRVAKRWEYLAGTPRGAWEADAKHYTAHNPGSQAVEWVDPSSRVRWIVPLDGNEAALDLDLTFEERRRTALETARNRRVVAVTRAFDLIQGGKGFRVYVPISQGKDFSGFITGVFLIKNLFDFILHEQVAPGYSVAVFDGLEQIYSRDQEGGGKGEAWGQEATIRLFGVTWRVRVFPGSGLLAETQSPLPEVTLVGGLLMAMLFSLTVHFFQTARLRAEAYRNSEARFRELYDQAPVGYHEIDTDGRIRRVNRTAQEMLGYTAEEMLGRGPWEFIEEQEESRQAIENKLSGGESTIPYERTWRRKDGTLIPVLMQDRFIRDADERVTGIRAILQDITERNQSEEALRESEARFRDLFDHAPVGYHEIDTDGRIRRVNRTAQRMLGYTAEEMLDRHPWEFIVEQEESRKAVTEKLSGRESIMPYERTWRRKDGTVIRVLMLDRFIRDADGRITGVRATIQDITERKMAEEALRESHLG